MPFLLGDSHLAGSSMLQGGLGQGGANVVTEIESASNWIVDSFVSPMLPFVGGIAGAFLVFWLFRLALRIIKRFAR